MKEKMMTARRREEAFAAAEEKTVRDKQKRMTKQKVLIWRILSQTKSHPTAEWVYGEARKVMPNISLGTVYRNLQMLVADGMAQELNYGKGVSRFDANMQLHYHFVCESCGRIYDVDTMLNDEIAAYAKICSCGKVQSYRLEFYGICAHCGAKGRKA